MSLFDTLKKVIFHNPMARPVSGTAPPAHTGRPAAPATNSRAPAPAAAARSGAQPAAAQPSAPPAQPAAVDVEAVLEALNAKSSQKLNWQTSIVDLMKLVGLDSSLKNRQELAAELGYSGDKNDSAAMNIWLHKAVMRKLAENGGKVPASLQ
jgi:3-oxoacyl-ACP reductase-like protein